MDNRGQVSVEVLILLAAVVAVSFLFVSQLHSTSQEFKKSTTHESSAVSKMISKIRG